MQAKKASSDRVRKLALTGILSSATVAVLIIESFVPTGRAGFYVLASFILSVIVLENGVKWGWGGYLVSSLAGFLLVPEKLNVLPFILFFGLYTLLKFHIETLRKMWLEIILKLAAFNVVLWPAWSFAKTFLPEKLTEGWGIAVAGIVLQVLFLFYDFLFTWWIHYYFEKIAPRVGRKKSDL